MTIQNALFNQLFEWNVVKGAKGQTSRDSERMLQMHGH